MDFQGSLDIPLWPCRRNRKNTPSACNWMEGKCLLCSARLLVKALQAEDFLPSRQFTVSEPDGLQSIYAWGFSDWPWLWIKLRGYSNSLIRTLSHLNFCLMFMHHSKLPFPYCGWLQFCGIRYLLKTKTCSSFLCKRCLHFRTITLFLVNTVLVTSFLFDSTVKI